MDMQFTKIGLATLRPRAHFFAWARLGYDSARETAKNRKHDDSEFRKCSRIRAFAWICQALLHLFHAPALPGNVIHSLILARVWEDPSTDMRLKRRLVRTLIEDSDDNEVETDSLARLQAYSDRDESSGEDIELVKDFPLAIGIVQSAPRICDKILLHTDRF